MRCARWSQEEPTLAARTTKDRGLRRWLLERGVRDAVVVALPLSSGSAGTLTVMDRLGETATFTEDDLTLLQTLTGHLGGRHPQHPAGRDGSATRPPTTR